MLYVFNVCYLSSSKLFSSYIAFLMFSSFLNSINANPLDNSPSNPIWIFTKLFIIPFYVIIFFNTFFKSSYLLTGIFGRFDIIKKLLNLISKIGFYIFSKSF